MTPFRTFLFVVVSLSLLSQAQFSYYDGFDQFATTLKIALTLGIITLLAAVCWKWRRIVTLLYLYLSPLALVLTAVFILNALGPERSVAVADENIAGRSSPMVEGPVVVLLFDGFALDVLLTPEEDIDQARFPNFASLAQDAVWFTNATSNYRFTCRSVPTLLTGRFAKPKRSTCFDREGFEETNVLSRLSDNYHVVTSGTGLSYCFSEEFTCLGGSSLSADHPLTWSKYLAKDVTVHLFPGFTRVGGFVNIVFHLAHQWSLLQFEEFLDGFSSDTATERLYYFHSTLPHPPYIYDATGKPGSPAYYVTRRHDPASLLPIAKTAEEMRLRYEEQSQYADSLLGRLIQRLRTEDLYEQATIIVTSDHGDRFGTIATQGESPRYGATGTSARIPLVIKSPSLRPQVLSVEYQHIDFSNTLLDVLGLPQDHDADGVSAFASQRPTREKVFYIGSARYVYDPQGQTWRQSVSEAQGTGAGVR